MKGNTAMSKRNKVIGVALVALFAFSAIAASAQAADQWFVNGTTLPTTQTRAVKGKSGVSRLTTPGLGLSIVCNKDVITNAKITNVSTSGVVEAHIQAQVHFTECVVKTHPGLAATTCVVHSAGAEGGTITTNLLTGKFNTSTGAHHAHVLLAPSSGTAFVEIEIEGCAFETGEPLPVTGNVEGSITNPAEANVEQHETTVSFPETALSGSTLKLGAFASTYSGTEELELEGAGEKAKLE
jgi:hypothetical protein